MLPILIFGRLKTYTASESGCVQITSLSLAFKFASGETKKSCVGRKNSKRKTEKNIYSFVVFVYRLAKIADCDMPGIVDHSEV